jgi:hypothetical protein
MKKNMMQMVMKKNMMQNLRLNIIMVEAVVEDETYLRWHNGERSIQEIQEAVVLFSTVWHGGERHIQEAV